MTRCVPAPAPALGSQGGMVLPLVMFATAVVSALLGISVFLGVWSARASRLGSAYEWAGDEAHAVLLTSVDSMDVATLTALDLGSSLPGSASASVTWRRLNGHLFFADARVERGGAEYRAGVLTRVVPPPFVLDRAVSSRGVLHLGPGAIIDDIGSHSPAFDDCDEPMGTSPTAPPTMFEDMATWIPRATSLLPSSTSPITVQPVYSSNRCMRADPLNWGDPLGSADCGLHFPAVHVPGDLTVGGGVGQGVLMVDGDLTLGGGFVYHGLVLVGGRLETTGLGAVVIGAVQIDDRNGVGSTLNGPTVISHSRCAVGRALVPMGNLELLPERAWIQVF
jgi:hypothetical protein